MQETCACIVESLLTATRATFDFLPWVSYACEKAVAMPLGRELLAVLAARLAEPRVSFVEAGGVNLLASVLRSEEEENNGYGYQARTHASRAALRLMTMLADADEAVEALFQAGVLSQIARLRFPMYPSNPGLCSRFPETKFKGGCTQVLTIIASRSAEASHAARRRQCVAGKAAGSGRAEGDSGDGGTAAGRSSEAAGRRGKAPAASGARRAREAADREAASVLLHSLRQASKDARGSN